jgi:hypothetical protein
LCKLSIGFLTKEHFSNPGHIATATLEREYLTYEGIAYPDFVMAADIVSHTPLNATLITTPEQLSLQEYSHTTMSGCAGIWSTEPLSSTALSISSIVSQLTSTPASLQARSPTPSTPSGGVSLQESITGSLEGIQFHTSVKHAVSESQDSALHWYGPECRSLQESESETLEHDQALLDKYVRKNNRLATQIDFLKAERKKKSPIAA